MFRHRLFVNSALLYSFCIYAISNKLDFQLFKHNLYTGLNSPLPGASAQHLMAPAGRNISDLQTGNFVGVKKAAVLALFYEQNSTAHLVLTLRKSYKGVHSNQISFPGGKRDKSDADYLQTALREAEEEIGISPTNVDVYGQLSPLYIPPSNFLVHPFVGIYNSKPHFTKQESEVEEIFSVTVDELLDDSFITNVTLNLRGVNMEVPTFLFKGYNVWGATAMMLSELRQILLLQ